MQSFFVLMMMITELFPKKPRKLISRVLNLSVLFCTKDWQDTTRRKKSFRKR